MNEKATYWNGANDQAEGGGGPGGPTDAAVVIGNAHSHADLDLDPLDKLLTIGCNRAMRGPNEYRPQFLMIADREVYIQERDNGNLASCVDLSPVQLMLSETIFDPKIKGRRADGNIHRQYPAQPEPDFFYWSWRVGSWATPFNWETFGRELSSFANIAGPMLQAAVIIGGTALRTVAFVGVDLKWQKEGPSHHFGDGKEVGAYPPQSLSLTVSRFRSARDELETRGIKLVNLSPVKDSPFARVIPCQDYEEFLCAHGT